jgi:hypothetical protein
MIWKELVKNRHTHVRDTIPESAWRCEKTHENNSRCQCQDSNRVFYKAIYQNCLGNRYYKKANQTNERNQIQYNIAACRGVRVTKITGSRTDDWIYSYFGYNLS